MCGGAIIFDIKAQIDESSPKLTKVQWPPLLSPVLLVAFVLNVLRCLYLVFQISNPKVWTMFPGVEDQSRTFNRGHCVTYSCMSDALSGGCLFFIFLCTLYF